MSLYSTYWHRVADIRPRLHSHVRLFRHTYRGQDWYVLQDPLSGRQHRFNRAAYTVIGLMDGRRTVQAIWDGTIAELGDEAPTQDETIRLLGQLHAADVLQSDIPADTLEMFERGAKQRGQWKQRLMNPFALRFPLVDPDNFLKRRVRLVRPLFGRIGFLLWLLVVGTAFITAAHHWPELTCDITDRVLSPKNVFLLWLVYPFVKLLHELGHAFATRVWGGEVHEMGIMLLVFTPIPYVEASASAAFSDKYKRITVAAAGMMVELFVASLALFVWLHVEPGTISAIAYNVMLIGGVSTLLFNGNPLLRFDGYFILSDWIEIPNLSARSTRYLGYLIQRYLFNMEEVVSPVTSPGERPWFVFYGIASFIYQIVILAALALFVSQKFFFIGILIACWAIIGRVVLPVARVIRGVYSSIDGRRRRTRIVTVSLAVTAALILLIFALPVPMRTRAQGVVFTPEHSRIRAGTDCVIREKLFQANSPVEQGSPLLRCEDPFLEAEYKILAANLAEAKAGYISEPLQNRVQREVLRKKTASAREALIRTKERKSELIIHSPKRGVPIFLDVENLPGHFVRQGTLLGYIVGAPETTVTVVISQPDISLVKNHTKTVRVKFADHLAATFTATIVRETPTAINILPSPALGTGGGGNIPVDPADPKKTRALTKYFQLEIRLPVPEQKVRIGERVYALFDHGCTPIGLQWYRLLRQLFLKSFHV
ncbi:MAG TPA: hypothetical protein ENK84_07735 [Desulfobulbus sp.]|nr:hypothetical protein [Desulfobulbus sp.]